MRLIEIRLYEGPNVYRLEPVVKLEVAVGRTRAWRGSRAGDPAAARLATPVAASEWPDAVVDLVSWVRRLRADQGETGVAGRGGGRLEVHRAADAGRWLVTWPWAASGQARATAEAAFDLASRSVSASRRTRLTGTQERLVRRWQERIAGARTSPPSWVRDDARRMPVISITGTNGKSTVTRLITHILLGAGHHVGTTTSDGILVDERLVDAGDWTGPGGAAAILGRDDVDIAVLETARGGLVLRGMGYESNDASVFTNISPDHLDLGGIHTLAQLAEVKATVCRITRPGGTVVLNADDPYVVPLARRVAGSVTWFSMAPERAGVSLARHRRAGGRAVVLADGVIVEWDGPECHELVAAAEIPVALGGAARHNVANALAAAAGARAMGVTREQVASGLRDFQPTPDLSPGRLNLFRLPDGRIVIVDFAHNEAGATVILEVAAAVAHGAPVTAIVGTAGDRPDDAIRAVARAAAGGADRLVLKETLHYLRGRERSDLVRLLRSGAAEAGRDGNSVPLHETELEALATELDRPAAGPGEVVVLFCHEQRAEAFELLAARGAQPLAPAVTGANRPDGLQPGSPAEPDA